MAAAGCESSWSLQAGGFGQFILTQRRGAGQLASVVVPDLEILRTVRAIRRTATKRSAIAYPMPLAPPVTMVALPLRFMGVLLSVLPVPGIPAADAGGKGQEGQLEGPARGKIAEAADRQSKRP